MERLESIEETLRQATEEIEVPDIFLDMMKTQKIAMHLQSEIITTLAEGVRVYNNLCLHNAHSDFA